MDETKLIKYIINEAADSERLEIEQWLDSHPDHRRKYEHIQWVWNKSQQIRPSTYIETETAWEHFKQKRDARTAPLAQQRHLSFWTWQKVAAMMAVFLVAMAAIYTGWMQPDNQFVSNLHLDTDSEAVSDTLFDGSIITLNKKSELAFNQSLISKDRNAKLIQGEAFFQVARNAKRPFHVEAGGVNITVLGTKFNVKKQAEQVEVILESGSVQVDYQDKTRIMKPGDRLLVNFTTGELAASTAPDQLYSYYVGEYFEAYQTPLWRVVDVLNEAYQANIIILNESLRNLPLTTTFRNDSLENNLEVLKQTFGLTVIREPDRIIIK